MFTMLYYRFIRTFFANVEYPNHEEITTILFIRQFTAIRRSVSYDQESEMPEYNDWNYRGHDQEHGSPSNKSGLLAILSNRTKKFDALTESVIFKMADTWLRNISGINLTKIVLGACAFTAVQEYSTEAMEWIAEHGTNTVIIDRDEVLASDLEIWIAQQPSSQFLNMLPMPSFQKLE